MRAGCDAGMGRGVFFPGKAGHLTTHPRRHCLGTLPIFFNSSNFSFFINSLHQRGSSHIYLHLEILLPLSLEPATRRINHPRTWSSDQSKCGSRKLGEKVCQLYLPTFCADIKLVKGSQSLPFYRGDTKTCDDKKAAVLIACAYLARTEAPFTPPVQKSDVLKLASL